MPFSYLPLPHPTPPLPPPSSKRQSTFHSRANTKWSGASKCSCGAIDSNKTMSEQNNRSVDPLLLIRTSDGTTDISVTRTPQICDHRGPHLSIGSAESILTIGLSCFVKKSKGKKPKVQKRLHSSVQQLVARIVKSSSKQTASKDLFFLFRH